MLSPYKGDVVHQNPLHLLVSFCSSEPVEHLPTHKFQVKSLFKRNLLFQQLNIYVRNWPNAFPIQSKQLLETINDDKTCWSLEWRIVV